MKHISSDKSSWEKWERFLSPTMMLVQKLNRYSSLNTRIYKLIKSKKHQRRMVSALFIAKKVPHCESTRKRFGHSNVSKLGYFALTQIRFLSVYRHKYNNWDALSLFFWNVKGRPKLFANQFSKQTRYFGSL